MAKLTIEFGDEANKLIAELADDEGRTKAEIVRRSVALYSLIQDELKKTGRRGRLSIASEDGKTVKEYLIP